jgi:hypothetical protein
VWIGRPLNQVLSTTARFRVDTEATPTFTVNKIQDLPFRYSLCHHVHQDRHTVNLNVFLFVWLIQSQPQTGAASAKTLNGNPQQFPAVFLQKRQQFLTRCISDFHHVNLPVFSLII